MSLSPACENMIKQQLRTNNIVDESILALYKEVSREDFLPKAYKSFAYSDSHIPLEQHQFMQTPLEEAKILQTAYLNKNMSVLEIGTGTGFLTYLLSKQCNNILSIEYFPELVEQAKTNLTKLNPSNIELMHFDAKNMTEIKQKFDVIICTSGIESIPSDWFQMLNSKAKIFAPIGIDSQNAQWIHIEQNKIIGHEFVFTTKLPMFISDSSTTKFIF